MARLRNKLAEIELENVIVCYIVLIFRVLKEATKNNINLLTEEEYKYLQTLGDFDLKSSQKSVYKINREHMIIQYGRMLPVNKKDIVTISIYPFNEQISIYKYDISKNKKYNIECYMACLNIT